MLLLYRKSEAGLREKNQRIQAAGKKVMFQAWSELRTTHQLSVMAGRDGKPGTWQNWEHPPPGQGAADSTLFCPDSRYKHRILLCSSPHRPTWKTKSYILLCVFQRIPVQQSSEIPLGHLNVPLWVPSWRDHEGMELLWGLVYTGCDREHVCAYLKVQPVNFGYNFPIPRPTHHSNNGNNQKGAYGKSVEWILLRVPTGTKTTSSSANSCRLGEQKEQLTYEFALFYSSLCILSWKPFLLVF